MSQESFEKEFSQLREMPDSFVLRGSSIIVEILDKEEIKTASGLIMATTDDHVKGNSINQHRLEAGRVLMVGPGYWIEGDGSNSIYGTGHYEPLEVKPGAIVILPQFATSVISVFPGIARPTKNKLGLIKMDSILCFYPSQEAYEQVKAKVN
jgi:co-chaperonin GroES (HSP10)